MKYSKSIRTSLYGEINNEIIASVFGQMSDGIWENSRTMKGYWKCAEHDLTDDNEVVINVSENYFERGYGGYTTKNPYCSMSNEEICKMFARRIRAIVKEEEKNNPSRNLKWSADNDTVLNYMGHGRYDIKVSDAYKAYKILIKK